MSFTPSVALLPSSVSSASSSAAFLPGDIGRGIQVALDVAAWACLAFGAGVLVYVVASFALMRAHTAGRPLRSTLRAALTESAWAILTQPLLPLWYVLGRRMGGPRGRGHGVPVVFVHGYFQNRVCFLGLAHALQRRRPVPLYGFNYPWTDLVDRNAGRLARFVEQVCVECDVPQVDLVCHSLGGVVAVDYVHEAGAARVRRLVTIASPHAGVAWRGPIPGTIGSQLRRGCAYLRDREGRRIAIPCLSIYSTHDNVVHPPLTSALTSRGGRDLMVDDVGHLSILFSPRVHNEVVGFLDAATPATDAGSLPPLTAVAV